MVRPGPVANSSGSGAGSAGGWGGGDSGGGAGGGWQRGPQSAQSSPSSQVMSSAVHKTLPGPPSSQSASLAKRQVSVHSPPVIGCGGGGVGDGGATAPGGGGEGDGGGGDAPGGRRPRRPQSMQSSPRVHRAYSAPGPPSSQSLSEAYLQLLLHIPGGLGGGPGGGHQADGAPEEQPPTRVLFAARPAVILEDIHRELRSFAACDPRGRLVVSPCHGLHPARRHSFQTLCSSAPCLSCGLVCRWASPTWATRPPR